jgi:hypothetical protein
MLEVVQQAQAQFLEIESILNSNIAKDQNYFMILSEMTDKAYVAMNNGMSESATVCHECAEHRDYLLSMLDLLEELSAGKEFTSEDKVQLDAFTQKIGEILSKISSALNA